MPNRGQTSHPPFDRSMLNVDGQQQASLERAWDAWQDEKYWRGETNQRARYTDNPFRPR